MLTMGIPTYTVGLYRSLAWQRYSTSFFLREKITKIKKERRKEKREGVMELFKYNKN
jgi:hypothetical protein